MTTRPRWFTDTDPDHSERYVERMRELAAEGADLAGEARLIDAMLPRSARVLDAGCGTGRTGAALHACGHVVVGVDADPVLLAAAREDHPGPTWLEADLTELRLDGEPFHGAVLAGNVLSFAAKGTQGQVLASVAGHLVPDGFVVVGFHTDLYSVAELTSALADTGLSLEHHFGTWDLRLPHDDSDFAVCVMRQHDTGPGL